MYLVHYRIGDNADQFLAKQPIDVLPLLEEEQNGNSRNYFLRIESIQTLSGRDLKEAVCLTS